jgi:hypothetical protein
MLVGPRRSLASAWFLVCQCGRGMVTKGRGQHQSPGLGSDFS